MCLPRRIYLMNIWVYLSSITYLSNVCVSEFALDPKLKEYIRDSKEAFSAKCASLDVDHLEYQTFTKKLIKERNLSPDAIMQFAIQVIRCHGF